jgi:hypothetical protein
VLVRVQVGSEQLMARTRYSFDHLKIQRGQSLGLRSNRCRYYERQFGGQNSFMVAP